MPDVGGGAVLPISFPLWVHVSVCAEPGESMPGTQRRFPFGEEHVCMSQQPLLSFRAVPCEPRSWWTFATVVPWLGGECNFSRTSCTLAVP